MANINLPCNLPEEKQAEVLGWFDYFLDDAEEQQMSSCFTQYLFYDSSWSERNIRVCYCSSCGQFDIYRNEAPSFFKHTHGDEVDCPVCGQGVKLVSLGKMKNFSSLNDEERRFSIFRVAPDGGLLVTSGWGTKQYSFGDLRPTVHYREKERAYFAPGVRMRWKSVWSYDGLYRNGCAHRAGWEPAGYVAEPFNPSMNYTSDGSYYLITAERIWDTRLQYSQLEDWYYDRCEVDLVESQEPVRYISKYLSAYTAYPYMEMAVKLGFYSAVEDLVLSGKKNADLLNWSANTSWGWLRLSKRDGRAFLRAEGNLELLRLYKEARKQSDIAHMQAFIELSVRIKGNENASKLLQASQKAGCTITEAVNYVERHGAPDGIKTVIQIWNDYLDMAAALGYDLTRRDVVMPKDLIDRHDAAAATTKILGKQIESKKFAKRTAMLRKMYEFEYGGYCIVVPASAGSIISEGKTLHHCVGGYAARHMEGKVDILFLRKTRKKGTPFITMELKARKSSTDPATIVQIHGYRNDSYGKGKHGQPAQQFAWFLDVWLDWLRQGSKRDSEGKPILPKVKETSA